MRRRLRVHHLRSFFFFSSRRRHTSSLREWSSDVCSSDLFLDRALAPAILLLGTGLIYSVLDPSFGLNEKTFTLFVSLVISQEIGRASCRERVWIAVVAGW